MERPARGKLSFSSTTGILTTGAAVSIFLALLVSWFLAPPPFPLSESVPGQDNRPAGLEPASGSRGRIGEFFQKYAGRPGAVLPDWPRFRGAAYDNRSPQPLKVGPSTNLHLLWTVPVGEGHAAPVVAGGRLYLLDYDEARQSDALRCLSPDTGEEIWRRWYPAALKRNHGFSRSIPTVAGGYVVTMGPRGHVMCVDASSGALRWGIDTTAEYGAEIPQWYAAQSPLVEGGEAVIATGGKVLMIGVDLESGVVNWQTPAVPGVAMSHSSVIPAVIAGRKVFLYSAVGALAGVSAERADRGKLLFLHREWDNAVVAPSPVPLPDGRIFLTAGYGGGSMMVKASPENGAWRTATLYRYRPKEGLACEQQTPILLRGLLYGIMPKDAGTYKSQFVCFDPDTRSFLWTTGKDLTFGLGPFLLAGEVFLILSETGTLYAMEAGRGGWRVLKQWEAIPKARDAWGPLALSGRRLFLRDLTRLLAVEIEDRP